MSRIDSISIPKVELSDIHLFPLCILLLPLINEIKAKDMEFLHVLGLITHVFVTNNSLTTTFFNAVILDVETMSIPQQFLAISVFPFFTPVWILGTVTPRNAYVELDYSEIQLLTVQ